MRELFGWLWQISVHVLAGWAVWQYSPDLFYATMSCLAGLCPIMLFFDARALQKQKNAEIEASWHAAYRDEELKGRKDG